MRSIPVKASRAYEVKIGSGLLARAGELSAPLIRGREAVIVSDSSVWPLYGDAVQASLESAGFRVDPFVFPAGERSKTPQTLMDLLTFLAQKGLSREDALRTLPAAVEAEGWAEIIKYGMIRSPELLKELKEKPVGAALEQVIAHCVSIKRDLVAEDEQDNAARQLLNFGHTVGHAIERCADYTVYHGEGVAMGMAIMTRACVKQGKCPAECLDVLEDLLNRYHLPKNCEIPKEDLLEAARADKKRRGSSITLVQPDRIGSCTLFKTDYHELEKVLEMGLKG